MLIIVALLHSLQHPHFWRATTTVENERERASKRVCAREGERLSKSNGDHWMLPLPPYGVSLCTLFLSLSRKWAHPGPESARARAREIIASSSSAIAPGANTNPSIMLARSKTAFIREGRRKERRGRQQQ